MQYSRQQFIETHAGLCADWAVLAESLDALAAAMLRPSEGVRPSTADVDAYFKPAEDVRRAAARVAAKMNVSADWLNDGVKGFLSDIADFTPFLELSNLRVLVAQPQYLLAMKCLAMRIGAEFP